MIKKILPFIIIFISLSASYTTEAQTAPANNFQCKPQIIGSGLLPSAPPCGATGGNLGTAVSTSGTTIGATNDSLSGPVTSCYPNSSPPIKDVWYQFTASDNHVQITIAGTITSPYIAIYESANNECVGLIPRDCFTALGSGTHTMEFGPLTYGVKYYLQVASATSSGNGNFQLVLQSKNNCGDCLQNSTLQSYPLPVQAAYPPNDSVGFCYSVIGYKQQFGNRLHGVVPEFGNGWDISTFKIIKVADSADFKGQWKYLTNVFIKGIKYNGFFYDVGNDNNPSNNLGDKGTPATIWTFCFTIKTKTTCVPGTDDLSIHFNTFSDGESGSLIATKNCAADSDYVFKAHMNCCPKPAIIYSDASACKGSPTGQIHAWGGNSALTWIYELYNSAGVKIDKQTLPVTSTYLKILLAEGNYYLYINNPTASCRTGVNVYVPGPVKYNIQQTVFGCGSGSCTNSAKIVLTSGTISNYNWSNGSTLSSAGNLCSGWNKVTLTVGTAGTCKFVDSIFINNQPVANANFKYEKRNYCTSEKFAVINNFPATTGGVFVIADSGTTRGSLISPNTGTIVLSGITIGGRIIVKYTTGPPCNAFSTDTIFIEASPPPVQIYKNQNVCVGDPNPIFKNIYNNTIKWYSDSSLTILKFTQTTNTSLDPFGGTTPPVGIYLYYLTQVSIATSTCQSVPIPIKITVYPEPVIDAGQNITICPSFGTVLKATGATGYSWSPVNLLNDASSSNPIASPTETTTFFVTGTDTISGCQSFDSVTVFINANGVCDIKVYTGFTPNGDNHNDYWQIDGIGIDEKNTVSIFNRWGEKVWETKHYDNQANKWEGKGPSGQLLPDGTYFYVILYKQETLKGWVELTR